MNGRAVFLLAVLGVLAMAVIISGCGSDSSTSASATAQPTPLSKAKFTKQANEICKSGKREKDSAVTQAMQKAAGQQNPSPKVFESIVEEAVLPAYSRTIEELDQLGPPKNDEATVKKIIGKFEAALKSVEANPIEASQRSPFVAADQAAENYGLNLCSL